MKQAYFILVILIVTGLAGSVGHAKGRRDQLTPVSDAQWRELAATELGVTDVVLHSSPLRWGYAPQIGWVILTGDISAPIGYRGPTSLMLLIDLSGTTLLKMALVESCDSPPYVDMLVSEGYIEKFTGKTITPDASLSVDAVSGATRTCSAIQGAVNESLTRFYDSIHEAP